MKVKDDTLLQIYNKAAAQLYYLSHHIIML